MNSSISIETGEEEALAPTNSSKRSVEININQLEVAEPDDELCKAAAAGNIEAFKDLSRDEIERVLTTGNKSTVLHINVRSQAEDEINLSIKFVEAILDMCPSLLLQVNADGDTSLHLAARRSGHSDMVRLLIERAKSSSSSESSAHGDGESQAAAAAAAAWQMIRMTNNEKNTALHEAVSHGNVDIVSILTKEYPDYHYPTNIYQKTPLYMAADSRSFWMVLQFLENCTSLSHEGPNGKTALHAAAMRFDFVNAALRKLIEKKKSVIKETDQYGWTPIHYAAYHGKYSMLNALLEIDQTASANVADKDRKMTALHLAAGRGDSRAVEAILSRCPECYDMVDNRGWNFLHYAMVSFNFEELVNLLENPLAKSLINEGDAEMNNTPLHILAAFRAVELYYVAIRKTRANYRALNNQNLSVENMFKSGSPPELKEEIQQLSFDGGRGQYTEGVILIRGTGGKNDRVSDYKETRASHLVVAALIATVAFAAAFTIPGGYKSENGTAILRRDTAFQAFMVTDTIAMVLSLAAVLIHFVLSFDFEETKQLDEALFESSVLFTTFSMGALVIAFVTGTYAMLAPSSGLAIAICLIGLSFFFIVIWVIRRSIQNDEIRQS